MSCEHVRTLIHERRPGDSIYKIQKEAGLPLNAIAYYLREDTHIDQIPALPKLKEIAAAIPCAIEDLVEAFAADAGIPLPVTAGPKRSATEKAWMHMFTLVDSDDRQMLLELFSTPYIEALLNFVKSGFLHTYARFGPGHRDTIRLMAQSLTNVPEKR
jgi:hypothetical protein